MLARIVRVVVLATLGDSEVLIWIVSVDLFYASIRVDVLFWFEQVGMLVVRFARSIKQLNTKPCCGRLLIENKCAHDMRQYELSRELRMWKKKSNPKAIYMNSVY